MARIKVDSDRRLGAVSPLIYGQFIEHLGRCIYGGIYEEGSPLSDQAGFRTDVMEAVRGLRVPIIRWPGGNFVSAYHWEDGIGPKDERPRRWDLAWKTEESNRFGTDEFLAYCRKVGAEPYVCVNTGTGTIEEAAQWVEYCNASCDTHHADLRRRNGYEEPHNVRWWGIGNEISGDWQIGKRQAEEHAWAAREYAKAMRRVDPSIKLVACGACGVNPTDWNLPLLRSTADLVDAIAVHRYIRRGDYYDMLAQALLAEDDIHIWNTAIDVAMHEAKKSERITIVFDEWNAHPSGRVEGHGRYTFTDALVVATFLNIFQRNCTTVEMANLAQMVNILAPIRTSAEGLFLTPIYHPLALYAEHCGTVALDTWVDVDTYETEVPVKAWAGAPQAGKVPFLDVSATVDEEKRTLTLACIARHQDTPVEAEVQLLGFRVEPVGRAYELMHDDLGAMNDFDAPDTVASTEREVGDLGECFRYTFPPHSLTLLVLELKT